MIIRPFLYDLKRTITSKSVLILTIITLLISLTIIPLTGINSSFPGFSESNILYYRDNTGYHFLAYSANQFGEPVSGTSVGITLTPTPPSGTMNYTQTARTNNTGLAFLTLNAPNATYYVAISTTTGGGVGKSSFPLRSWPMGHVELISGRPMATVVDRTNAAKRDIQVFYAAPFGAVPLGYSLYYKVVNSFSSFYGNQSEMTFLGNLTGYHQIFDPPLPNNLNETSQVFFGLFKPNNSTALYTSQFAGFELRQPQTRINGTNIATFFFSTILSFFMPLVAIIGSYTSYGKDRLTGVLESVLARPVSRRGLAISRFFSTIVAVGIAGVASVGLVDLILHSVSGTFLPQDFTLAIMAALLVEVAAFTGLVFFLSHVVKSTGALLGIMIGLFVVLDFFWTLIILLLTSLLGGTLGSEVSLQAAILSYFANPAQFITLVNAYLFQSTSGIPIQTSNFGLTLPALVLDGVLWAAVPFAIFLYLAVNRD
ncbi:hypothetical protein E6H29_03780 [Candidatus Bathyarchaeota archaeon]|nr:MAG: hypothetical protein E6H29_03780 [Candidatus Bathyarchaeota archaeon]